MKVVTCDWLPGQYASNQIFKIYTISGKKKSGTFSNRFDPFSLSGLIAGTHNVDAH